MIRDQAFTDFEKYLNDADVHKIIRKQSFYNEVQYFARTLFSIPLESTQVRIKKTDVRAYVFTGVRLRKEGEEGLAARVQTTSFNFHCWEVENGEVRTESVPDTRSIPKSNASFNGSEPENGLPVKDTLRKGDDLPPLQTPPSEVSSDEKLVRSCGSTTNQPYEDPHGVIQQDVDFLTFDPASRSQTQQSGSKGAHSSLTNSDQQLPDMSVLELDRVLSGNLATGDVEHKRKNMISCTERLKGEQSWTTLHQPFRYKVFTLKGYNLFLKQHSDDVQEEQ